MDNLKKENIMTTQEFKIEGMSCNHCVMAVKKELSKVENLDVQDVQIGSAKVAYEEAKVSQEAIRSAIETAGYKVVA